MKVFVIDVNRCNGCHNCQIACKDEFCENDWSPYSKPQPEIGQFWIEVKEKVRGQVPVVKLSYIPVIGSHSDKIVEMAPECAYKREDGFVLIDPEKAKGRKDIADAFPGDVWWNEELQIPQKCTGCAHLLDDGWTEPRCVDSCPTEALRYVEKDEVDLSDAVQLEEGSLVYYLNYPKRFAAGEVVDRAINEVLIGATVELIDAEGSIIETLLTDEFGDYKFDQIEPAVYTVRINAEGYETFELVADVTDEDKFLGDHFLTKA